MTNPQALKDQLGNYTQQVEKQLEPYQRGAIFLTLTFLLLISIYLLSQKERPEPRELTESERKRIEALVEERILKRAEFLKKLRE